MAGPPQSELAEGGCFAVLSSYLKKRKEKKHNAPKNAPKNTPKNAPSPIYETKASPARSTDLPVPLSSYQEANAATNDEPVEIQTDLAQDNVDESGKKKERNPDLWSQAYQKIDDKTKEWIGDACKKASDSGEQRTQDLVTLVRKREEEYKKETPKLKVGGYEIVWRDYADRVVMWVTLIGDLLSGGSAPAPSPVIWSALKVLLKANVSQCEDLAAIFGCAEEVLRLTRHEQERKVSIAAHACGAVASQEHQRLLKSLDEPLRNVGDTVKKLGEKFDESAMIEALGYISKIPIGEHQQEKRDSRIPTTCNWLLKHPKFLEWDMSDCSSTLWLQGNVGAGKTFLTSKVIDHLSATSQQQTKYGEGFAYFYCSRSDPMRQETKYILRSYISQLARVPNNPNMMEKNIHKLYLNAKKEQRGFSTAECETALTGLVNFYHRTTFVLDALDECERESREALARILGNLVDVGEGTVKVFIASRKEDDIEEYPGLQKLIAISTADNHNDIEKYIESEVDKVGGAWRSVSTEVKEQVKRTIAEKSDGMFRWAYLQWQQLKKLRTNETIRERLGKLPKSLTEAYDEIYSQAEEKIVLQRAVKWVLCAAKPLTSEVLLAAVRLGSNSRSIALSDAIDESTLESICSHLVVLDPRLKVWKFSHASVAEYFEDQHRGWIGRASEDVAILLVSCLIDCYSEWTLPIWEVEARAFLNDTPDLDNHLDARHPLQEYASLYWTQHALNIANQSQEVPGLTEILKRFLGSKGSPQGSSRQYQAWSQLGRLRQNLEYCLPFQNDDVQPSKNSIFGICAFGLHRLLKGWWDKDIDVSQVNARRYHKAEGILGTCGRLDKAPATAAAAAAALSSAPGGGNEGKALLATIAYL
ncbi:hypothetical protein TgHK011_010051 [Trichoderma gracile]|nr:hypothetical protein TgHK011_010051 [Trichoderma gracile]